MNLSKPFIERPVMTTMLILFLILTSLLAYRKISVKDIPAVESPTIHVITSYSGASPEIIANQITLPLEQELVQLKSLELIESSSYQGQSFINLKFDLSKDMDKASRETQSAINRAQGRLPREIDAPPLYYIASDNPEYIIHIVLSSTELSAQEQLDYAEEYIKPALSSIEGVAKVSLFGVDNSRYLSLNPETSLQKNISIEQISQTVQQFGKDLPTGHLKIAGNKIPLKISAKKSNLNNLLNTPIVGSATLLSEVVTESTHHTSKFDLKIYTNNQPKKAAVISLQKTAEGNSIDISNKVKTVIQKASQAAPSSLKIDLWFNKAKWIEESIWDTEMTIYFAFFLVAIIIYLSFKSLMETVIISFSILLTVAATISTIYFLGFSLNLLSLLAITLAIGFMVDDAIVVVENILRYMEMGKSKLISCLEGSKEICFTVFAITISLLAIFAPLLFIDSADIRLFKEFSVTLSVALIWSAIISITICPMLCHILLAKHKTELLESNFTKKINQSYQRSLRKVLQHPIKVIIISLLIVLAALPLALELKIQPVPEEDRGFMYATVQLAPETSLEIKNKIVALIEKSLSNVSEIKNYLSLKQKESINLLITLKDISQRASQKEIIQKIQTDLDQIPAIYTYIHGYNLINLDFELEKTSSFKYRLSAADPSLLAKSSNEIVAMLNNEPTVSFASNYSSKSLPQIELTINEVLASRVGINKRHIEKYLQEMFADNYLGSYTENGLEKKVYLDIAPNYLESDTALNFAAIKGPEKNIPLKNIASWQLNFSPPQILKKDLLYTSIINFSLKDEASAKKELANIQKEINNILPTETIGGFEGAAADIDKFSSGLSWLLLAATLSMYIILAILYESFSQPITILSSLPLAGWGGIISLYLFDEPISIFSSVGFLLLIGIVKKNGIMMVDFALKSPLNQTDEKEALIEACSVRFRPIMLTTIAAIMGALPIAIGIGEAAAMYRGLGIVLAGGLIFSQLLTLYLTPAIYLKIAQLNKKIEKKWFLKEKNEIRG